MKEKPKLIGDAMKIRLETLTQVILKTYMHLRLK